MAYDKLTPEQEGYALISIQMAFDILEELPEHASVKKGDIIKATYLVDQDPLFKDSEIFIVGYGRESVIGTSVKRNHPAYMFPADWSVEQLNEELENGMWTMSGSLKKYSTSKGEEVFSYFKEINAL